jgi:hypothetical protein
MSIGYSFIASRSQQLPSRADRAEDFFRDVRDDCSQSVHPNCASPSTTDLSVDLGGLHRDGRSRMCRPSCCGPIVVCMRFYLSHFPSTISPNEIEKRNGSIRRRPEVLGA